MLRLRIPYTRFLALSPANSLFANLTALLSTNCIIVFRYMTVKLEATRVVMI